MIRSVDGVLRHRGTVRTDGREDMKMRKRLFAALIAVGTAALVQNPATAQVKRVELDIAGYLCGF